MCLNVNKTYNLCQNSTKINFEIFQKSNSILVQILIYFQNLNFFLTQPLGRNLGINVKIGVKVAKYHLLRSSQNDDENWFRGFVWAVVVETNAQIWSYMCKLKHFFNIIRIMDIGLGVKVG